MKRRFLHAMKWLIWEIPKGILKHSKNAQRSGVFAEKEQSAVRRSSPSLPRGQAIKPYCDAVQPF